MAYKILLVDDDQDFRAELRECLAEYQIMEAANGLEALQLIKRPNDIDLVILDVVMPGIRGTELLKEIKKIEPALPVVILTGFSSKDIVIEALKGQADDYIEKPFDLGMTKEILARILDRTGKFDDERKDDPAAKIKSFIERNWNRKLSLESVGEAVGFSPKYLSRFFKQATGIGFNAYIQKIKANEAKRLLLETRLNVNEISDRLGYDNPESFIRLFKRTSHFTPMQYRKKDPKKTSRKKSINCRTWL